MSATQVEEKMNRISDPGNFLKLNICEKPITEDLLYHETFHQRNNRDCKGQAGDEKLFAKIFDFIMYPDSEARISTWTFRCNSATKPPPTKAVSDINRLRR